MEDSNKKMRGGLNKPIVWLVLGVVIIVGGVWLIFFSPPAASGGEIIQINNVSLKVERATTAITQYNGLSGREFLCPDCGMIFVWPERATRNFVMRNMNFPLDIIFIDQNKIIKIDANLPPEGKSPTKIYSSLQPADMVLEVNAGYAAGQGLKVGDSLIFQK
jgi:uncharacterized membrane protein (UPF0127 family)